MVLVEVQDAVVGCGLLLERDLDLVGLLRRERGCSLRLPCSLDSYRGGLAVRVIMECSMPCDRMAPRQQDSVYPGGAPMESLYRKYRPLTFDSVVGQQHIVSTLEHAITEGRLSHAYLFCGPRGTGKTTMARILAKALLCRNAEAARAEGASGCMPDGTCEECELIAEGNHPDVYELDAASRTGVDNVREEIINSVNFAPVRGKYKIYIIDEVHMLTTAASTRCSRRSRSRRHT